MTDDFHPLLNPRGFRIEPPHIQFHIAGEIMADRPKKIDATQLPADEWAKHFAAWLGRPEADATVSKTLAALLAAVIAAHGQVSLTREQVIQNAHRPIQLRRTKAAVILFLGEPELTDEPDDDTG